MSQNWSGYKAHRSLKKTNLGILMLAIVYNEVLLHACPTSQPGIGCIYLPKRSKQHAWSIFV